MEQYIAGLTRLSITVFNGKKQPVFCIDPTVLIPNEVTHGYEKNPLPDIFRWIKSSN